MISKLKCALGIHDYRWMRNEGDQSLVKCNRCDETTYVPQFTPDCVEEMDVWAGVDWSRNNE